MMSGRYIITFSFLILLMAALPLFSERSAVLGAFAAGKTPALAREAAEIAKEAIKAAIAGKPAPAVRARSPLLRKRAGVFVTLTINGRVCGCMGNLDPQEPDIAREIAVNAVAAARGDSRYRPVSMRDLGRIRYLISVAGPRRQIYSISEINPSTHGLLVQRNGRGGVLLPGEAKTARWQIAECRRKAGISPEDPANMYIFETVVLEYGPYGVR